MRLYTLNPISQQSIVKLLTGFKAVSSNFPISYNGHKLDKNLLAATTCVYRGMKSHPEAAELLRQTATYGAFLTHGPNKLKNVFKQEGSCIFILQVVLNFLKRELIAADEFTDAEMEKWSRAMKGLHDIIEAIQQAAAVLGTAQAFQNALSLCACPLEYDRTKVETIGVSSEQKPMIELLVSLLERERDEELSALTGESKSGLSFIDLLQTVDSPLGKDYRFALQSLSAMQHGVAHVPVQALMTGGAKVCQQPCQ